MLIESYVCILERDRLIVWVRNGFVFREGHARVSFEGLMQSRNVSIFL